MWHLAVKRKNVRLTPVGRLFFVARHGSLSLRFGTDQRDRAPLFFHLCYP